MESNFLSSLLIEQPNAGGLLGSHSGAQAPSNLWLCLPLEYWVLCIQHMERKENMARHILLQLLGPYIPSTHTLLMRTSLKAHFPTSLPGELASAVSGCAVSPSGNPNTAHWWPFSCLHHIWVDNNRARAPWKGIFFNRIHPARCITS